MAISLLLDLTHSNDKIFQKNQTKFTFRRENG
jgi:hypothetical protein